MRTHARAAATSAAVLAAVFLAGALVGRATVGGADGRGDGEARTEAAEGREDRGERRRTPMYEQVGLTETQLVEVDSMVVHYRTRVRKLQHDSRQAYEAQYALLVDSLREGIKGVMSEAQRAQYDSLLAESDERRRARRDREDEDGREDGTR
ncbi:MAG: hypothetical protein RQ751_05200 [Longimicrobiales bacterium]|nr:hypothetical protein [Longimicrobiales bacterium]